MLDDSTYFIPVDYVNKFSGEVRGKQTKGPTVKHRSIIDDSSDDEDSWVDNDTGGSMEEGDPTDGLREAVEKTTRHLKTSDSTSGVATTTHASTLPEPGPSADSSQHNHSRPTLGNVNTTETSLSGGDAPRVDQDEGDTHAGETSLDRKSVV